MKIKTGIVIFFLLIFFKVAGAADPYNYADLWGSWSVTTKEAYISGVVDGLREAYIVTSWNLAQDKLTKKPEPIEVKKVKEIVFVRNTRSQICDVITDLYKDPANAFIDTMYMFFLARDKIEGKNIENAIMHWRKVAMETHRANEALNIQK